MRYSAPCSSYSYSDRDKRLFANTISIEYEYENAYEYDMGDLPWKRCRGRMPYTGSVALMPAM